MRQKDDDTRRRLYTEHINEYSPFALETNADENSTTPAKASEAQPQNTTADERVYRETDTKGMDRDEVLFWSIVHSDKPDYDDRDDADYSDGEERKMDAPDLVETELDRAEVDESITRRRSRRRNNFRAVYEVDDRFGEKYFCFFFVFALPNSLSSLYICSKRDSNDIL